MLPSSRHVCSNRLFPRANSSVRGYSTPIYEVGQIRDSRPQRRSKVKVRELDRLSTSFIKAIRGGELRPGWKHSIKRRKDTDYKETSVHPARWQVAPSFEKTAFSGQPTAPGFVDYAGPLGTVGLEKGDFVEIRRVDAVRHGVILGIEKGRIPKTTTLVATGEVLNILSSDIMFKIPRFIDSDSLRRCGKDEFATDDRSLAARQRVVKTLRDFERIVESTYSSMSWEVKRLYDRVKSDDPDGWSTISTMEAARLINSPPNPPIVKLFAVHKHLMTRSEEFVAQPIMHRQCHKFSVRPESHMANIRTVMQWIRDGDPSLVSFCEKAQRIIKQARRYAEESFGEPPSMADSIEEHFTEDDKKYINLLRLSLDENRFTQMSPYVIAAPAILKKVGMYESNDINSGVVLDFLRDIGVHTPWEDLASKNRDWHFLLGKPEDNARIDIDETGFLIDDPHEAVRHDFGQLPVYVVDDPDAKELDDGVSLEPDPHDSSSVWLHVHVADPTSVLSHTHPDALQARRRMETGYFIHETFPMIPKSVINKAGLRASSDAPTGKPQKVLTFSAKLNGSGDILDYKVRAAVVHSVHTFSYDDVDAVLGIPKVSLHGAFDSLLEPQSVPSKVSEAQLAAKDLSKILEVTETLVTARLKLPVLSYAHPKPNISLTPTPTPTPSVPSSLHGPVLFRGFPMLSYSILDSNSSFVGSRSMVAESMKVACRIASRFCSEHNIPMYRRAAGPLEFSNPGDLDKVLALRDSRGIVAESAMGHYMFHAPPGEYTLKPKQHWAMGVPEGEGYIRVTSPLRRFQDMVAHWQIKAALLPASEKGGLPFSADELMKVIDETNNFARVFGRVMRHHERYWANMYIDRYLKSSGAVPDHLLRNLDAYALSFGQRDFRSMIYHTDVFIPSLGMMADLRTAKQSPYQYGSPLNVRVGSVERGLFPQLLVELEDKQP